jgi:ethanolamine utilization microcompartment shell protein EutL
VTVINKYRDNSSAQGVEMWRAYLQITCKKLTAVKSIKREVIKYSSPAVKTSFSLLK